MTRVVVYLPDLKLVVIVKINYKIRLAFMIKKMSRSDLNVSLIGDIGFDFGWLQNARIFDM